MSASPTSSRVAGQPTRGRKVAIVGSGCAGLATLWALNRTQHDAYLYEATNRLGGHTNTVEWRQGKYRAQVDTGFIVLNAATYPNFIRFLERVGVPIEATEMTFAVSRDQGAFEWAGTNLGTVFCQRRNLVSLRMWRMIFDIIRFSQFALDLLRDTDTSSPGQDESIGHYLQREGYSDAFRDDYLIPMTAAIWSTGPDKCALEFPAVTLVRFLWNHHLLSVAATRPTWLTVTEGSRTYVEAIMKGFPSNHVFLNTAVQSLTNDDDGRVRLHLSNGESAVYDHVVLATHGDQAFNIVRDSATDQERAILSCFQTSQNEAVLHSDIALMPVRRNAWSSWNYLTASSSPAAGTQGIDQVSLTYNMNILQHIPRETFGDVLVTLNPLQEPDPCTVQGRFEYAHPLYNAAAIQAQKGLSTIQNKRGISYAGAWTKYGFHEDGFTSGLRVASEHFGARLPFPLTDSTFSRGGRPQLGLRDWILRLVITIIQLLLVNPAQQLLGSLLIQKTLVQINGSLKQGTKLKFA